MSHDLENNAFGNIYGLVVLFVDYTHFFCIIIRYCRTPKTQNNPVLLCRLFLPVLHGT